MGEARRHTIDSFSICCVGVKRNVKLYICICVDMQSQCVLGEIPMQMLFTSMVSKETTSYVLRHKVLKVSNVTKHSSLLSRSPD